MSRFETEKACFALRRDEGLAAFKQDPDAFLSAFDLTDAERRAIREGDIGFLYTHDVLFGALEPMARLFKYDQEEYVRRLRQAAGLPELPEQTEILRKRAALRKKGG